MSNDTIISLFLNAAERHRDDPAFTSFDQTWKSITYGAFLNLVKALASHLVKSGITKGEKVAILSENRVEWCAAYLGILMSGGVAVPIDAQLGAPEVRNLLDDSSAVLVFHSDRTGPSVSVPHALSFDSPRFRDILSTTESEDYPEISEDDLASIVYTSGTTGRPKGVMLTHRNFCSDALALMKAGLVTGSDSVLSVLPLHHTYSFMCTFLVPLFLGAAIIYPKGLKGPELVSTMKEQGVTVLVAVPQLLELIRNGILRRFGEMPGPVPFILRILMTVSGWIRRISGLNMGKVIFASAHETFGERFRFFASGGARLDPLVMEDLESLGFTVLEGYGLTETSPVVTFNPVEKRKAGSAGKPLPSVEIQIMNPSGSGEGEIAIRGPMVMRGYYNNPEATAKVIRDGWFLSGDLGYLDHENYLFITGRAKDVIVLSSGKNIYPEDVEKEYLKIPLIKEICVTAAEERGMVESLHGIIVPDLDYAREKRIGNIQEFLKTAINQVSMTMPPPMRLRGFTLSSESLPRTPLGKVKRFMMKDLLEKARAGKKATREEDLSLLQDETGRVIVECIAALQREKVPVHASDNLELDLGLDSLQRIELVVAIEKAFSLKLPETFASEIQTVEELLHRVKDEKSKGAPAAERAAGEDVFSAELTEGEKREIGFLPGRVEWFVVALLLNVVRLILKIFFKLETKGIGNLPEPPFIIASNHASNMDGFVVGSTVPLKVFRILFFQGFQVYFSGWWLPSLFGRLAHAIPIDPETFLSNALRLSSYVLRKKRILCIFPEGGRTFDGTIMPFKKGIGILAMKLNVPVVPALIEGTFEALPRGAKWPKMRKVRISFGRPYHPSELDLSRKPEGVDGYQYFADEVRKRVKELSSAT